jgi:hypothetical protein
MSNPNPPPGGQPASARARTLPLQPLVNRVIRGLLRTPLLCRLAGRRLITVYLAGRNRAALRHPGRLHSPQPNPAGRQPVRLGARNLHSGEPVHIRLAGQRRPADVQVVADQARRREVDLVILPTAEAISVLTKTTKDTNAILHLTC